MSSNTMKFDILHNFISPVTGRVLSTPDYVLVGDNNGIATPSPILIHIRLDLIALRRRYNTLVTGDLIIGHPNEQLPNAQVLVNLADGFLYNTAGVVSTLPIIPIGSLPDLTYQNIWIGDISNRPVERQRVDLVNLPSFRTLDITNNFGIYNLYQGQFVGLLSPLDVAQPTRTLRIDMSNMPNVSVGKMLIGVRNILPPDITIDSIPPFVHVLNSLNWDARGALSDSYGVPNEIGLDPGYMFIGSSDPLKLGQIEVTNHLPVSTLPDLTYQKIWRGDITNRPVESSDLTILEGKVSIVESDITAINTDLVGINADLLAINTTLYTPVVGVVSQVAEMYLTLYAPLVGLVTVVAGLTTTVVGLVINVATNTSNISLLLLRTLDQVPLAIANVNLNNNRIINLSDPINPLDAVNLQTLQTYIGGSGTVTSVTGTAGRITVVNNTTTPIVNIDPTYIGQSSITTLGTITTGTWNGTTIDVVRGGTGRSSSNINALIVGGTTSTSALQSLSYGTAGQILTSTGSLSLPVWANASTGTVTSVTGTAGRITVINNTTTPVVNIAPTYIGQSSITTLGTITTGTWNGTTITVARGGTGRNSFNINALVVGGITGTSALQSLSYGTAGQVLTSNGASSLPIWTNAATGTVTSVTGTAGRITVINNTTTPVVNIDPTYIGQSSITTLGLISSGIWNGTTVSVSYGGTGGNTYIPYSVICGGITSTGAYQSVGSTGTAGQVLTSTGAGSYPIWSTPAYGAIYMQNNLITNVLTANVYQKINGTTAISSVNQFTMPSSNALQYTGTTPIVAHATVVASYSVSNNNDISIAFYKNGVFFSNSVMYLNYRALGTPIDPISTTALIPMTTNDIVETYIRATSNGTATVSYLILTITTT